MSLNSVTAMDVDSPAGATTLKRCSSAPMINDNNAGMATLPPANSSAREQPAFNVFAPNPTRTRRFSLSCSPSAGSSVRLTPRINQLRQEESADITNSRELAHEREIHHAMQISQSWEDLSLVPESQEAAVKNKMGPLHVSLPPYGGGGGSGSHHHHNCNSPSPTRLSSPGFQSPTRTPRLNTFVRRSASPVLRPSPLGTKRKLDDDKLEYHTSPRAKRFHSYSAIDRGGLLTTTSNSLPGSLSSVGTPESLSSADSPGFLRMLDSPSPNRAPPPEPMLVSKNDHDMTESPS